MINLLPPEGHKAVKREYVLRVGAAIFLLFAGVAIFLTVSLIPTYVLIGAQINSSEALTTEASDDAERYEDAEAEVKEIEMIMAQLQKRPQTQDISTIVAEIRKRASSAISFKTFRIDTAKKALIQIQGVAETRESLAQFRTALEASDLFAKAEVPISDLARETELPFAITITLEE